MGIKRLGAGLRAVCVSHAPRGFCGGVEAAPVRIRHEAHVSLHVFDFLQAQRAAETLIPSAVDAVFCAADQRLIRSALAALAVLVFTFVWNDYFWALCLTESDHAAPLTVGVAALQGQWTTAWNLVSAGSLWLVAKCPDILPLNSQRQPIYPGLLRIA